MLGGRSLMGNLLGIISVVVNLMRRMIRRLLNSDVLLGRRLNGLILLCTRLWLRMLRVAWLRLVRIIRRRCGYV